MKQFLVENTRKMQTIKVTMHNPPFEDENVLERTNWKIFMFFYMLFIHHPCFISASSNSLLICPQASQPNA